MIIASLKDIDRQVNCGGDMTQALDFLKKTINEVPLGRFELNVNNLFGYSQAYKTNKADSELTYEAHRKYIDVQYIVSGSERIRWVNVNDLNITDEYSADSDCSLGKYSKKDFGEAVFKAGDVVIMYPQDAHAASISFLDKPQDVIKLIVKVPYEGELN